jgi:hypothetical protein
MGGKQKAMADTPESSDVGTSVENALPAPPAPSEATPPPSDTVNERSAPPLPSEHDETSESSLALQSAQSAPDARSESAPEIMEESTESGEPLRRDLVSSLYKAIIEDATCFRPCFEVFKAANNS